ncbi:MAG: NAD(P)/FAD-dependent oxidoreductase [Saprospiraceae bacterium]
MSTIVIIGNGIAGSSAARYIRKLSEHRIIMISEETLQPFSRTALMYIYMGHLKKDSTELYEDWFWEKNRIERIQAKVTNIDTTRKCVELNNGSELHYDKLIIASGSKSNKFGWKGQDLIGVQGLYHLKDLESMESFSKGLKRAVIVGGGLIGIEMAEMFASRGIAVTFLVRESNFWNNIIPEEESLMVSRHIREHHIDLQLGTELQEIIGDENGKVCAIINSKGERIECGFVGLTVGVSPNIPSFSPADGIAVNRGVLVDEYLTTTNPDIYAIGDCAEIKQPETGRRPIEAIWYTGRMMGQTVAHTICGKQTKYKPRLWFNSAKFFDIEYQVYGTVPAKQTEGIESLYWEHPDGKKSIRICYSTAKGNPVVGFNLMGIRYRHEVCEKWILENTPLEDVLTNLSLTNFDPEFFDMYETYLIRQYNTTINQKITLHSDRNLNAVRRFLNKFA